ncbi:similar to Saccharomyces cerevisiae YDR173C ARG82 Inositol polyphosphate multikinase (IPMK), sequentially phosphorylates Ins(1,4,5)P3 to form Ins(1,3,4,5,6)P5 [Maudiozyma barnettii]|uniref:Kinase n=1 Tax=Maudiozyma barnettii TaxID=61262 RepID=A0A8H2VHA1_9SACH|nr:inositol polyphosphate multikinase [Kazachstania barnettii]CAB4255656.1 similar to Saccharomyces cerevisiae YDR173C ARG82 Inositol polyphosphate multikinase (IPMK), sequentially phosphorylates Ins(1,4,5)P3 to form Ins(1,3,4,5,6)P5 [Kazachstania barnettii]CAD1784217.1 similar to Saccharomyces cerevisiae YDR173C ARG82 Inositol polyphosphate multikinase (IPMK), sequentially phosphorylates Ins(1,4,5)P3 to form Ins(1,3,4,5,6)P5 [Kazachstania barnettii]
MSGYKELEHKAAGHDGTLTDEDGLLIFKPLNEQELQFYKDVQQQSVANQDKEEDGDVPLESWIPVFLGVLDEGHNVPKNLTNDVHIVDSGESLINLTPDRENGGESNIAEKRFLVLQNLTAGFKKPNIIDIKLGKILYDDNATEEKRQRLSEVSQTTTSGSLGFRICGMRIQENKKTSSIEKDHHTFQSDGEYIFINKMFGRTRTPDDVIDAFGTYFANSLLSEKRCSTLKQLFFQRLQLFYNTILNSEVRMISSSLLFIYEGDPSRWDSQNDEDALISDDFIDYEDDEDSDSDELPSKTPLSLMALIDFAHSKVTKGAGYDENVIEGVESLLNVFSKLNEQSI